MWMLLFSLVTAEAMPTNQFQTLSASVEEANFGSDQLRILRTLPEDTTLTVPQAVALLDELSFASEQLQALELLAPFIIDRTQQYQIIQNFTFSSDKDKAEQVLNRIAPNQQIQPTQHPQRSLQYDLEYKERQLQAKELELQALQQQLESKEQRLNQRAERLRIRRANLDAWESRLQSWENRLSRRSNSYRGDYGSYPYNSETNHRRNGRRY